MLYRTNNKRQNFEKIGLVILSVFAILLWYYFLSPSPVPIIIVFTIEAVLVLFIIRIFKKSAFELIFEDEKIIYSKKFEKQIIEFKYTELKEVHYFESYGKTPSFNKFVFHSGNKDLKLRTDIVEYGEAFVNFIKFLKEKNPEFNTYVTPKGTQMHMRLRQEILNTEF